MFFMFLKMEQGSLFPDQRRAVTDEEHTEVLRLALACAGRLTRIVDLLLSNACAEHLVEQLHLADLEVVRCAPIRFRE